MRERTLKMAFARYVAVVAAALPLLAFGDGGKAAAKRQKREFPEIFQHPPADAVKALKRTVGRPFNSGFVFIGGKYMEPPYRVERCGNVLRINGVQISGEIVPWEDFIKTQSGVKVTKTEAPPPAYEPPMLEPEQESYYYYDNSQDEDMDTSLDDLFDDAPSTKRKKTAAKKPRPRPRPKPRQPAPVISYSFDGEFTTNETTNAYKDSINAERTRIDRLLRAGGFICCGPGYQMVSGDAGATKHLTDRLPDIMKLNPTRESFGAAITAAGFKYMPQKLIDDLFRNRVD
jgi:hypothetical protein